MPPVPDDQTSPYGVARKRKRSPPQPELSSTPERQGDRSSGDDDGDPHRLLSGYADLEPFAKEVGRSPRTVRRWFDKPDGLPYTKIGNRILIHIPTAKAWIFGRMRNPSPAQSARRGGAR
jgi:hypothetical protein